MLKKNCGTIVSSLKSLITSNYLKSKALLLQNRNSEVLKDHEDSSHPDPCLPGIALKWAEGLGRWQLKLFLQYDKQYLFAKLFN